MQSSAGIESAIIAGPAISGLLFVASAGAVYVTCTLIFRVAGFLLLRLRYAHVPPPAERASSRSLLAGVAYVWERKISPGAASLDLFAVLLGGATALVYPCSHATFCRSGRVAWGCCVRPRR